MLHRDFIQARTTSKIPWIDDFLDLVKVPEMEWIDYFEVIYYAFLLQKPRKILELGTNVGGSLGAMALAGELCMIEDKEFEYHIWTVDTTQIENTKAFFDTHVPGRVTFIEHDANKLEWEPERQIDLLYIDNGHTVVDVDSQLIRFTPFLARDGLVILDDTNMVEINSGIESFLGGSPSWTRIDHSYLHVNTPLNVGNPGLMFPILGGMTFMRRKN